MIPCSICLSLFDYLSLSPQDPSICCKCRISFFLLSEWYCCVCVRARVCVCDIFCIHSSVDEHLGCLHILAIVNKDAAAAAAKSLQSCPTLCDPVDGCPPGSPIPGILQGRTLEWVAISFSNAWKWEVKVKSLFATPWTAAYQAPPSMGFFQARVLEWVAIAFSLLGLGYCK